MTGAAKQSIRPLAETWIASSLSLLAMTTKSAIEPALAEWNARGLRLV
jgi:hypothetical protein